MLTPTPADPDAVVPVRVTRRRALGTLLALGGAGVATLQSAARAADALHATPANAFGPFYPAQKPADSDADLPTSPRCRACATRGGHRAVHVGARARRDGQP
jgi:hypothetical protein